MSTTIPLYIKNATVRLASTGDYQIANPLSSFPIFDSVTTQQGDLVLLRRQHNPSENGVYTVPAIGGTFQRLTDTVTPSKIDFGNFEAYPGLLVEVQEGAFYAKSVWQCVSPAETGSAGPIATSKLPIIFQNVRPQELRIGDPSTVAVTSTEITRVVQQHLDAQVDFNNPPAGGPTGTITQLVVLEASPTYTLDLISHNGAIIYCSNGNALGALQVNMPTGAVTKPFLVIIVKMTQAGVSFFESTLGTVTLAVRFEAWAVWNNGSGWNKSVSSTALQPNGGRSAYFGPGQWVINGIGIKSHPSVDIIGAGHGNTEFVGDPNLTGDPDDPVNSNEFGLLTVAARIPNGSNKVEDMWQPEIKGISFKGGNVSGTGYLKVDGIVLESGNADPFYPSLGNNYRGGSASFRDVGAYDFPNWGINSLGNRQRLHALYLRCTGNGRVVTSPPNGGGGGLRVAGNDPVIGERCAFGGNDGWQFQAQGFSGLIVSGVNFYTAGHNSGGTNLRSATSLVWINNCNGTTVTNCVFNDSLIITQTDPTTLAIGVSITGCDFNPNNTDIFDDNGVPMGGADFFINVNGAVNASIVGNTFSRNTGNNTFKNLISAASTAKVGFAGETVLSGGNSAVRGTTKTPFTCDSSSLISYSVSDLNNGSRYNGVIPGGSSSVFPIIRGLNPASVIGVTNYAAYATVDNGPSLQVMSPELTDGSAAAFLSVTAVGTFNVPIGARYAVLINSSSSTNISGYTINIQTPTDHTPQDIPITVVVRGGSGHTFTGLVWQNNASTISMASGEVTPNASVLNKLTVELLFRPGTGWYILQQVSS